MYENPFDFSHEKHTPIALGIVGAVLTTWRPRHAITYWTVVGIGATAGAIYRAWKEERRDLEERARLAGRLSGEGAQDGQE